MRWFSRCVLWGVALCAVVLWGCSDSSSGGEEGTCGNGVCLMEEVNSCPQDCGEGDPVCGDGTCSEGESALLCARDCGQGSACGDGVCRVAELESCAEDCGAGVPVCGNGRCSSGEDAATCPEDCQAIESCTYPRPGPRVDLGEVMPALYWQSAYDGPGDTEDFGMRDFFCNPHYDAFNTVAFIVGAGWCPACPDYIREVGRRAEDLEELGMLVVFVEVETQDSAPANNRDADQFVRDATGSSPSFRVGDGVTKPTAGAIARAPFITSFPNAFIVRRSDMKIIATQSDSAGILPFEDIARSPQDWDPSSSGSNDANCGPEDEEPLEPNDNPQTAPRLEPGTFSGGVCAPGADFYRVELQGSWTFNLEFEHAVGDLDVHIWDLETNEALLNTGSNSSDDNESFTHTGPATVMVYGYGLATAPYTLTLTEN